MATKRPSGEWRRRTLAWYDMPTSHCELCGRPLTSRVYAVLDGDRERLFCGPDCESMSRTTPAENAAAEP